MFACMFAGDELTASLWGVDCVTSRPSDELTCDELTVWRVDRVTSWLAAGRRTAWHIEQLQHTRLKMKIKSLNTSSLIAVMSCAGSRQVARRSMLIVNELGYEVRLQVELETGTIFNRSRNLIPCCRRAVAEGAPTKIVKRLFKIYKRFCHLFPKCFCPVI